MAMKEHDEGLAQSVSDQAAEWFIRLRDRDLTMADRRKFVRWLKQAPSHIAEFMRLCQLYGRVKRAKVPTLPPEELGSNVIALMQRESVRVEEPERRRLFVSRKFMVAAAACCLALVGVISKVALTSNTIETRLSEFRTVQLADGSRVNVGPNTLLHVDFSDDLRRVICSAAKRCSRSRRTPHAHSSSTPADFSPALSVRASRSTGAKTAFAS
jgi:transmembrane sensor